MSIDSIPQNRRCSQCKQEYPATIEYFRSCPREKLGITYACRECLKKRDREYLANHREENKVRSKRRYHVKKSEYQQYKKDHADIVAQQKRDWRKNNPDKVKAQKQRSDERHPESKARRMNRYNKKYPELRRLRGRITDMKKRAKMDRDWKRSDLIQVYEDQNGLCAYCGVRIFWDIPYDLHIDHIKPLSKYGGNEINNLNLTCADCNLSKHDLDLDEWVKVRGW